MRIPPSPTKKFAQRLAKKFAKKFVYAIAGLSVAVVAAPQPSFAQDAINLQNYESPNPKDPFSQGIEQDNFSMFQLLHNATLGGMQMNFQPEEGITDEVSRFRARQAEAFKQRQNSSNTTNTTNSTTTK